MCWIGCTCCTAWFLQNRCIRIGTIIVWHRFSGIREGIYWVRIEKHHHARYSNERPMTFKGRRIQLRMKNDHYGLKMKCCDTQENDCKWEWWNQKKSFEEVTDSIILFVMSFTEFSPLDPWKLSIWRHLARREWRECTKWRSLCEK